MDLPGDQLTTRPIQMGWEFTINPYPSWRFGYIDNPDRQFGKGSVWTRTQTQRACPDPLLTQNVIRPPALLWTMQFVESSSWQGTEIWGTIGIVVVNCAPILASSKGEGKTAAETASDEPVLSTMRALSEFPLLGSKQNHSALSVKAPDGAWKQFYN